MIEQHRAALGEYLDLHSSNYGQKRNTTRL